MRTYQHRAFARRVHDSTSLAWCSYPATCREEGTKHLEIPFAPSVVKRTVEILFTAPGQCGGVAPAPAPVNAQGEQTSAASQGPASAATEAGRR